GGPRSDRRARLQGDCAALQRRLVPFRCGCGGAAARIVAGSRRLCGGRKACARRSFQTQRRRGRRAPAPADEVHITPLLFGVAVLLSLLAAARFIAHANTQLLARNLRRGGGVAALAGAVYFTAIGRFPVAIPLGLFGLGLLELLPRVYPFSPFRAQPSPGQT